MLDSKRCEVCEWCDTKGKRVHCFITGEVIRDINKANFNCPFKSPQQKGR